MVIIHEFTVPTVPELCQTIHTPAGAKGDTLSSLPGPEAFWSRL